MPQVHFVNERVSVEVPRGATLRDVAIQQGIEIYRGMWTHLNCLGNGICGRCKVWILSQPSTVSKRSVRERFHRIQGTQRLACQVRLLGDVAIHTRPIGPAVVQAETADFSKVEPSYGEAARVRYQEAKAEAARKAQEEAAKKKAEAAAAKKKAAAEEAANKKAEEEAAKKAEEEAAKKNAKAEPAEPADKGTQESA